MLVFKLISLVENPCSFYNSGPLSLTCKRISYSLKKISFPETLGRAAQPFVPCYPCIRHGQDLPAILRSFHCHNFIVVYCCYIYLLYLIVTLLSLQISQGQMLNLFFKPSQRLELTSVFGQRVWRLP